MNNINTKQLAYSIYNQKKSSLSSEFYETFMTDMNSVELS